MKETDKEKKGGVARCLRFTESSVGVVIKGEGYQGVIVAREES